MTGKEEALEIIRGEYTTAERARRAGNAGMVRVCARRAAGAATEWWYASRGATGVSSDVMVRLHQLSGDTTLPAEIRDAAGRLTAKVGADFSSPDHADLLADSRLIVGYLMKENV